MGLLPKRKWGAGRNRKKRRESAEVWGMGGLDRLGGGFASRPGKKRHQQQREKKEIRGKRETSGWKARQSALASTKRGEAGTSLAARKRPNEREASPRSMRKKEEPRMAWNPTFGH